MILPIEPPFPPMEAKTLGELPSSGDWQFEPKWDGFRCLAYRDSGEVYLQSRSGQPLARYFPEVVEAVSRVPASRFVLDGELVTPIQGILSFDDLLQRIHPAESRVKKLAASTPAKMIVFDLLVDEAGESLLGLPLRERRGRVEGFAEGNLLGNESFRLSPASTELEVAARWLAGTGGNLDGVMVKKPDLPYQSGERTGMFKVKTLKTVDCVVGGFRYGTDSELVGSLLLGLYDDKGLLHHVGFVSGMKTADKPRITRELEERIGPPGFTGKSPGGPSRWSTERSMEFKPLRPELVVEVQYDHMTGGRFRTGCRLQRFRPDKPAHECTMKQVERATSLDIEV